VYPDVWHRLTFSDSQRPVCEQHNWESYMLWRRDPITLRWGWHWLTECIHCGKSWQYAHPRPVKYRQYEFAVWDRDSFGWLPVEPVLDTDLYFDKSMVEYTKVRRWLFKILTTSLDDYTNWEGSPVLPEVPQGLWGKDWVQREKGINILGIPVQRMQEW